MSDDKKVVDLRSYFPKFDRKLVWVDGVEYSIREIEDLSEAEFHSMLEEEQRLGEMTGAERIATLKRHLQTMLVAALPVHASASAGERSLFADSIDDIKAGDIIYLTDGLYVERNAVNAVDKFVEVLEPWRFGASAASSRLFRAIRSESLSDPNMSQKQLMVAIATVKNPPPENDGGGERPQTAASGSTS